MEKVAIDRRKPLDKDQSTIPAPSEEVKGSFLALVGSAKPIGRDISSIEDDRLQYLLSK